MRWAFHAEGIVDAKEFYNALSMSAVSTHARLMAAFAEEAEREGPLKPVWEEALRRQSESGAQTEHSDAEATIYKRLLTDLGMSDVRPQRVSKIAGQLRPELKQEFDPIFKICSKLMHRTALSISSTLT